MLALADFLLAQLHRDLRLRVLPQDRQGNACPVRVTPNQLRQLIRFHQDLVVKHLDDVVLLHSGGGRWAIWHHVVHHQPEAFRQVQLLAHHARDA